MSRAVSLCVILVTGVALYAAGPHGGSTLIQWRLGGSVRNSPSELPDPVFLPLSLRYTFVRPPECGPSELQIPSVTLNSSIGMMSASVAPFGVIARFRRPAPTSIGRIRVAVELSGHLRTYRKCAAALQRNVLGPNDARVFIATYPDIGNKRYGDRTFRHAESAESVATEVDLLAAYGSTYLDTVYLLDYPSITLAVKKVIRSADPHFAWILYQLLTMKLSHDLVDPGDQIAPIADVSIRLRPDLYVLGPLLIRVANESVEGHDRYLVRYQCGNLEFTSSFGNESLLQAPHHPQLQWGPIAGADHSLIGTVASMRRFTGAFFTALGSMSIADLESQYFFRGMYAEKMWLRFAQSRGITLKVVAGWHVLLRDAASYSNTTVSDERSRKRRAMLAAIFSVTDPGTVPCPLRSGLTRTTLHPITRGGKSRS